MLIRLVALALLLTLRAGADAPSYSPGTYKYSLLTVIKRSQSFSNSEITSTITADQRMALALSAHGDDSLAFQLTITEYSLHSDLPAQLPDVGKMKGTMVMGTMSTGGRLASFSHVSPVTAGADVDALAEKMSHFLPALESDTGAAASFADTTTDKLGGEGGSITERTITVTTLDGDTVFAGARAFRIRHSSALASAGTIMQSGVPLPLTSDGTGDGMFYVSEKGVYLGARVVSTSTSRISLPTGAIVTLTQDATSTVTLLK